MRFGVPAVVLFISPFVYIGATISKEGAAFLEENDIFVPDDDDWSEYWLVDLELVQFPHLLFQNNLTLLDSRLLYHAPV